MDNIICISICCKNIMQKIIQNKIVRYIFSGGISSVSVFVLLYVLVHTLHIWYLFSSVIAFCFGIVVSFCLHKFVTFNERTKTKIFIQFLIFFLHNLAMLGVNTLLMFVFVEVCKFWYLGAQIGITVLTSFVNFLVFKKVIFHTKTKKKT